MKVHTPSTSLRFIALVALQTGLTSWSCAQTGANVEATPPAAEIVEQEPIEASEQATFDPTHAVWNEVLQTHVKGGGFDYAALKADRAKLDEYIAAIQSVTPEQVASWGEKERFAFWINTYNAFTIQKVIDNYPLKSIRKLDKNLGLTTVFEQGFIPLRRFDPDGDGERLSLNDIEHRILREEFKDARLHAAINCASYSCPPLRAEAFVAERLDEQLEEQMRLFVSDPERNRFDREKGRLQLSEIFKWFKDDFERDAGSVKEYVARFAAAEDADFIEKAKVRYIDYDWDLNDAPSE